MRRDRKIWIKRCGAILLAGIFACSLIACKDSGNRKNSSTEKMAAQDDIEGSGGASARGRYIEKEKELNGAVDRFTNLTRLADGGIAFLNRKDGKLYRSMDEGESWESSEIPGLSALVKEKGKALELLAFAVAKDGGIFFGYIDWESGESTAETRYPTHYFYISPDKEEEELSLSMDAGYLTTAVFTEDGALYGADAAGKIYQVNRKDQTVQYLFTPEDVFYQSLGSCGNSLIVLDSNQAYFYQAGDAEPEHGDEVLNAQIQKEVAAGGSPVIASGAEDKLYLAGTSGIYAHVPGGSVMEQLADGALLTLGEPERIPTVMVAGGKADFLIGYRDGMLCSYTYDPDLPAVPEKQLNVYSLDNNPTVRQAISSFCRQNPDVYVKLEIGRGEEGAITANDAVKNLNTKLLAGEGPDILILDGLPVESYMEKGILSDLSGVLKDAGKDARYFTNLFGAWQKGEQTYAVPLRFQVTLLGGDEKKISGLTDLKSLADLAEQTREADTVTKTVFGLYTAEELLELLVPVNINAWFGSDGTVKKDAMEEFFTQAKRIYQAEQKNLDEEAKNAHLRALELKNSHDTIGSIPDNATSVLIDYMNYAVGPLRNSEDYPKTMAALNKMEGSGIVAMPAQAGHVFCAKGIAGMNAGSNQQELAAEFIKELLSTRVQSYDSRDGLPVNRDAFLKWTEKTANVNDGISMAIGGSDGNVVGVDYSYWPTEEEWQKLLSVINSCKEPSLTDEAILDAVKSVGKTILTDDKTIEDGINEITQKIELYDKE